MKSGGGECEWDETLSLFSPQSVSINVRTLISTIYTISKKYSLYKYVYSIHT